MRVDPANAATLKAALTNELHDFVMGHDWRLVHQEIVRKQLLTGALIPDEKLAEDEIMSVDLASRQQSLEFSGVRCAIGQEGDPDRRVHQDHQATGCLAASRRRGCVRGPRFLTS